MRIVRQNYIPDTRVIRLANGSHFPRKENLVRSGKGKGVLNIIQAVFRSKNVMKIYWNVELFHTF
jgi:hypothetical protein